jgi:predicted outer membrane repeat protein
VINGGAINKNIARTINGTGGAIYCGAQVILNGVKLEDNCADKMGGAIRNDGGSLLLDENTILARNTAAKGAAISNRNDGNIELRCRLIKNQAGEDGGAVYNEGNLSLYGAAVLGNNATYGSAIYNEGNLTLVGGKIEDNRALIGGSIWNANRMTMVRVKINETGNPSPPLS